MTVTEGVAENLKGIFLSRYHPSNRKIQEAISFSGKGNARGGGSRAEKVGARFQLGDGVSRGGGPHRPAEQR